MELNLCWWNIGISPPVRTQKKDKTEAVALAKHYIKKLSLERKVDFFAICEISEDEAMDFSDLAKKLHLTYLDLSGKVGRVIIDISVMYERSKIEYISHKYITQVQPDERTLRVGVRVVFKENISGKIITFFLSHWPSVLSATESTRENVAIALRNNIDRIFEKYGVESQILCMGDYNTNPYSSAIHEKLYTTRDYHLIKEKRRLLFNPFWYLLSDKKTNNIGTYHYKSASSNRWYVFDQIIFSSSFLYGNHSCLKLDINSLDFQKVLEDDNKCLDDRFFKTFDHYPIFCRVSHGQ
ncbi:endonuclease/exonuclease/phosphatase family protein [Serratia plymuthica]|uniref:endonuclease/exonuclease/phosphatase family protein n=1 Tax=Serratia plymuthica TaxID=82996 RepID=UPI00390CB43D